MLFENHKEAVEEENQKNKKQQDSQKMPDMKSSMDSMMKSSGMKLPTGFSTPSMPSFK